MFEYDCRGKATICRVLKEKKENTIKQPFLKSGKRKPLAEKRVKRKHCIFIFT